MFVVVCVYVQIFQDFADHDGDGEISNWEYYIALDPNDPDANDYVFDHFRWDHCDPLV